MRRPGAAALTPGAALSPGSVLGPVLGAALRAVLRAALGAALGAGLGSAAGAEPLALPGRVSDTDFYRAASCAAPPGGACTAPLLRWDTEKPIRVALRPLDPAYTGRRKPRAEAALTRAVQQLNGAGAGFHLAEVGPRNRAEISVHFLGVSPGGTVEGTGLGWADGAAIGEVSTRLAVDPETGRIHAAAVLVSTGLATAAYEAALLSALTGAMGLTTELRAPAYDGLSALARAGAAPTRLAPQDAAALRLHYPPVR